MTNPQPPTWPNKQGTPFVSSKQLSQEQNVPDFFDPSNPQPQKSKSVSLPIWGLVLIIIGAFLVGTLPGALINTHHELSTRQQDARYREMSEKYQSSQDQIKKLKQQLKDADSDDDTDSDSTSDADSDDDDAQEWQGIPQEDLKDAPSVKIGDTQTSGNFSLKLEGVEHPTSFIAQGHYDDVPKKLVPKAGKQFVAVHTTVTNHGKNPIDLSCDYAIHVDAFDSQYVPYLVYDNEFAIPGNPPCFVNLTTGQSRKMTYVFEVPKSATIAGIYWYDVGDGDHFGPRRVFKF
jgi:hypothetical protein